MTRLLGAAVAVVLLAAHRVSDHDAVLFAGALGWTALSLGVLIRREHWQRRPVAWLVDATVVLGMVWLSADWRSPFYVLALTTLILPATTLPFRRAVLWGAGFTGGYLAVAIATELDAGTLRSSIRVETAATHLMVPLVVTLALAYAAQLLEQLRAERARGERLAIEAERRRIAWELHDSAKQRVHAAALVLSATAGQPHAAARDAIDHALRELRAAGADMDSSVAELRAPLADGSVDELLRGRARELGRISGAEIVVHGVLPAVPPVLATHVYRIAAEALTNAVRHSGATRIDVLLGGGADRVSIVVRDNGGGLPPSLRPGSHGLRFMRARAEAIGGRLEIAGGPDGVGTTVTLSLPTLNPGGEMIA